MGGGGADEVFRGRVGGVEKPEFVDYLFVGEGPDKGKAYELAVKLQEACSKETVVVVDPKPCNYELPPNMSYVQMGVVEYLGGRSPASVRRIRDDFAFHFVAFGEVGKSPAAAREFAVHALTDILSGRPPSGLPDTKGNSRKYAKAAHRALTQGGEWTLLHSAGLDPQRYVPVLKEAGFRVQQQKLTEQEVRDSGSKQARETMKMGMDIYRTTATKT